MQLTFLDFSFLGLRINIDILLPGFLEDVETLPVF